MKILVPLKRVADPDNANKVKVPADEEGVYLKPEMSATVSFFQGPAKNKSNKSGIE